MDICQIVACTLSEIDYEADPSETAAICDGVEERIRSQYMVTQAKILYAFGFFAIMIGLIFGLDYVSRRLTSNRRAR